MEKPFSTSWTLTARWVFPVDGPPLERGVVAVADDKIVAVEAARPAVRRPRPRRRRRPAGAGQRAYPSGPVGDARPRPADAGLHRLVAASNRSSAGPHAGASAGRHPGGIGRMPALRHDAARRHLRRRRQLGRARRCAGAGGGLPRIPGTDEGPRLRRLGTPRPLARLPNRHADLPSRRQPACALQRPFLALLRRRHPRRARRRPPRGNGGGTGTARPPARAVRPLPPGPRRLGAGRSGGRHRPCPAPPQRPGADAPRSRQLPQPGRRDPGQRQPRLLPAHPRRLRPSASSVSGVPGPRRPRRRRHRQPRLQPRPRRAGRNPLPPPPLSRRARRDAPAHGHAVRRRGARLGRRNRQPRRPASPPTSSSCRCRRATMPTRTASSSAPTCRCGASSSAGAGRLATGVALETGPAKSYQTR